MTETYPYKILHIDLSKTKPEFVALEKDAAYYLVLWWDSVPLGEIYLEKNESKEDLATKIAAAIKVPKDQYTEEKTNIASSNDVSVIICTRNRSDQLRLCLSSLMELTEKPAEVIVVDNAPMDDSTKMVASEFTFVTYVVEPRPGLDIARNAGIKAARSSIVAYVDDDVRVHPNWLSQVAASFENEEIMAMTGLVLAASLDTEAQQIFEKHWPFNRGYVEKTYGTDYFKKTLRAGPPTWEIGAGANMAFRRSIFEKVGYFDERLDVGAAGCNGDSELWFRILKNGYSIFYNPRAVVYHFHRTEMHALKKQLFNYMKGFTTAALIQQQQTKTAGYRRRLFGSLPKFYLQLLVKAFPNYKFRNRTIISEIKGMIAGFRYYLKNKNKKAY